MKVRFAAGALIVVATICLLLSIAILLEAGLGSRGATVASWVEAIATVLALGAAGVASVFAWRAYHLEVERNDQYSRERARAQAERFSGWCGQADIEVRLSSGTVFSAGMTDAILLRNASDLPLYRVHVTLRTLDGSNMGTHEVGTVPPDNEPTIVQLTPEMRESVDEARQEYEATYADRAASSIVIPSAFALEVELIFTDAAKVAWRRTADGALDPLT